MYGLGVDIGYSSVKLSVTAENGEIVHGTYSMHKGDIRKTLAHELRMLLGKYPADNIKWVAATGSGVSLITESNGLPVINEVQAVLEGCLYANNRIKSIIEIGGQNSKFITGISNRCKAKIKVAMNSSCSAGTGSFLEEQALRLKINISEYSTYAQRAKSIPRIAGRCSVFAKTDITHHQQEGVPVEDILVGLAHALVKNYKGTVVRRLPLNKPIMFAGGVGFNQAIIDALKSVFGLSDDDLVVADQCGNVAANGAALEALKHRMVFNVSHLLEYSEHQHDEHILSDGTVGLLPLASFGSGDSDGKHECIHREFIAGEPFFLGVDVGSTSTNLVLVNSNDDIVSHRYLRTMGNPTKAVLTGLKELCEGWPDTPSIAGVGVTGSGRYMIGEYIGADCIKDEITAQARAATVLDRSVDTVFEIGGQDSKFIRLKDGKVCDFQMNKVCAAGTGSFIEEQAGKFDIPINEFGDLALSSNSPIDLGERCTVFIETSISSHLACGASLKDIASGLCYSIAKNYLNRVVGQKPIGDTISFQGGLAYNQGVINAFRALTGKKYLCHHFLVLAVHLVQHLSPKKK